MDSLRARKRLKLEAPSGSATLKGNSILEYAPVEDSNTTRQSGSLHRPITPPPRKLSLKPSESPFVKTSSAEPNSLTIGQTENRQDVELIPSPVQLTKIEGLLASDNLDTLGLQDILGDPLIRECWVFNYLFDVDFLMSNFDEDVRALVQVKLVHGSWKAEDSNKAHIDDAIRRYPNVQSITAYMPEAYGTHHSKMMILFRHDEQAQIVILTANILSRDWRMCQALWRSPPLPLLTALTDRATTLSSPPKLGSGSRFKIDLIDYLKSYRGRLKGLISQLKEYDFSSIRAALVASVPGKQNLHSCNPEEETLWGWPGLRNALQNVPCKQGEGSPGIVIQVSSVASLGPTDRWLAQTLFQTLQTMSIPAKVRSHTPKFSLVFPTADEIRRSLDGYASGGSIHFKTQSAAQQKQLEYLKPHLCHWSGDGIPQSSSRPLTEDKDRQAGRRRTAPHIKTYTRFNDESMSSIDWALVTSANLSTQAWGMSTNAVGDVRICSYEIGVLLWPDLWKENEDDAVEMVPLFKQDSVGNKVFDRGHEKLPNCGKKNVTRVGWRMPYDLPLVPYMQDEMPWCATAPCREPDWMGRSWPGFGAS